MIFRALLLSCLLATVSVFSCGQKDPTRFDQGSILVDSDPEQAGIILDGNSTGLLTPHAIANVSAGHHHVAVALEGYRSDPEDLEVTVMAGEAASAFFVLTEAQYGAIFVDSDPRGATIVLDGNSTGQVTPDTLAQVLTGQHTLRVSLAGYASDPDSQVVQVNEGQTANSFFTLAGIVLSKTVLVEEFTNTSCIPCAEAGPLLDAIVADLGRDKVVAVKYHTGFPGATDPFYLSNRSDSDTRTMYYYITGIPHLRVDGSTVSPSLDSTRIRQDIDTRLALSSPITLAADYEIVGNQYTVSARVIALSDPGIDDLVIHFAVVEGGIHIEPPPGTNGETDFEHVMREMLPDAGGESFTISQGDTLFFERQFTIDPAWTGSNIETIVFVQSRSGLEVIQACSDHR